MLNTGFKTFSTPDYKIGTAANTATVGLWDAVKTSSAQAWDFNPSSSLFRTFEMQDAMSVSDKVIPKAELNAKYAHLGLFFEKDTREGVVDYIVDRKNIELKRQQILSRGPQSLAAKSVYLGAGLVTSFADPINIASAFIPVVREARFASLVARLGATRARLSKGFIEGAVGNALVEPIVYAQAKKEQSDYDQYDAFLNIGFGSILGGGLHTGIGKIGDVIAAKTGKANIYQRLAKAHPKMHDDLMRHTMTKVLNNERVNTGEVINTSRLNNDTLIQIDLEKANLKRSLIEERKKLNAENEKIFKDKNELKSKIAVLEKLDPKRKLKYIGSLKKIKDLKSKLRDLEAKEKANVEKIVNQNKVVSRIKNTQLSNDNLDVNPNRVDPVQENRTVQMEEVEAENLSLRAKDMEKQLDNKAISDDVAANNKAIEEIDNKIKNKTKIRDAIKAGANCVFRRS
tara:strand:+ start:1412 stop:2782 length:1371 start_codon:yes stop_codon:yes gene_type:complete